jgi:hypothetical protein
VGHKNINVTYETGIREVVKGGVIRLVEGVPSKELPVYLSHQGYIPYETPNKTEVGKAIDAMAQMDFSGFILSELEPRIRRPLRTVVKEQDKALREQLQSALQEIEDSPPGEAPEVLTLFKEVPPSRIVATWDAYCPYSVVRIQPVKDLTKILRILAQVTKPGAGVLILDACDSLRLFVPPVPEFMGFFGAYTMDQHEKGMERDVTALIESRVRVLPEWQLIDRTQICVPSSIPGNLERFCRSYALMIEIVKRVGEIPVTESVKTAWCRWCEGALRYTQVGLNILTLQRQSDASR